MHKTIANSLKNVFSKQIEGNSRYLQFIILFGILFLFLQISDLTLTHYALKNPQIRELNPLYYQEWFIPFKLATVFLIMAMMYMIPASSRRLSENAMIGMLFMYVFINFNNIYYLFKV